MTHPPKLQKEIMENKRKLIEEIATKIIRLMNINPNAIRPFLLGQCIRILVWPNDYNTCEIREIDDNLRHIMEKEIA